VCAAGALRFPRYRELANFLQTAQGAGPAPLPAAWAATLVPQRPVPDLGGDVGLGWFLKGDVDKPTVWRNGGTAGYRSFVGFVPGVAGVAVLTNHNASVDQIGFALLGENRRSRPRRRWPMRRITSAAFRSCRPLPST